MWSEGLLGWYVREGRHGLPWRLTRDAWAVLVSEVMLQQTSVARVGARWQRFLDRWPTPADCAAAPLEEVLREWDGLGYPRRARALHQAAAAVAHTGWPATESGLLELPGVGAYTAGALLALSALGEGTPPRRVPRDVNVHRVVARAAVGCEPRSAGGARVEAELAAGRPADASVRDYTLALFDLGATVCRARVARCDSCPLRRCRSRGRPAAPLPGSRAARRPAYPGSLRQLRGAVLRVMLAGDPPAGLEELAARVAAVPAAARPGAVARALEGLRHDGLLPAGWRPPR